MEVDPRGRKARWRGIDERPRAIAFATLQAVRRRTGSAPSRLPAKQPEIAPAS